MPQSGNIVVNGIQKGDTDVSTFVLNLVEGKLSRKKISEPCNDNGAIFLSSLTINGYEQLAACSHKCYAIKIFNYCTGEWSTAFNEQPKNFCPAGNGVIFAQLQNDSIFQLNAAGCVFEGPLKTIHADMTIKNMCYIPPPTNALVVRYWNSSLVAISVKENKVIWTFQDQNKANSNLKNKELVKDRTGLLFYPKENVLFVAEGINNRVLILKPQDGSIVQTIDLPDVGNILALDWFYDKIIMLHEDGDDHNISFYKIVFPISY